MTTCRRAPSGASSLGSKVFVSVARWAWALYFFKSAGGVDHLWKIQANALAEIKISRYPL